MGEHCVRWRYGVKKGIIHCYPKVSLTPESTNPTDPFDEKTSLGKVTKDCSNPRPKNELGLSLSSSFSRAKRSLHAFGPCWACQRAHELGQDFGPGRIEYWSYLRQAFLHAQAFKLSLGVVNASWKQKNASWRFYQSFRLEEHSSNIFYQNMFLGIKMQKLASGDVQDLLCYDDKFKLVRFF